MSMPAERVQVGRYVFRCYVAAAMQPAGTVIAKANPNRVGLAFTTPFTTERVRPAACEDALAFYNVPNDGRPLEFLYQFWGDLVMSEWVSWDGTTSNITVTELLENP